MRPGRADQDKKCGLQELRFDRQSLAFATRPGMRGRPFNSLELGGSNDLKNLWPEPYEGEEFNAHVKDQLENWLHAEVCAGRMPSKEAQKEISSNWIEAFKKTPERARRSSDPSGRIVQSKAAADV